MITHVPPTPSDLIALCPSRATALSPPTLTAAGVPVFSPCASSLHVRPLSLAAGQGMRRSRFCLREPGGEAAVALSLPRLGCQGQKQSMPRGRSRERIEPLSLPLPAGQSVGTFDPHYVLSYMLPLRKTFRQIFLLIFFSLFY